jgi:hypothetical protein
MSVMAVGWGFIALILSSSFRVLIISSILALALFWRIFPIILKTGGREEKMYIQKATSEMASLDLTIWFQISRSKEK